jgi:hypothetical protein
MRAEKARLLPISLTALGFLFLAAYAGAQSQSEKTGTDSKFVIFPPNHDNDLKFYLGNGRVEKGSEALGRMQTEADLVLWLAGNQFFAMDDVIGVFQKENAEIKVGLLTLPPGLLLTAIENGGWIYGGKEFAGAPDVYASVNLEHLKQLKKNRLLETYAVYIHNELQIDAEPRQRRNHAVLCPEGIGAPWGVADHLRWEGVLLLSDDRAKLVYSRASS